MFVIETRTVNASGTRLTAWKHLASFPNEAEAMAYARMLDQDGLDPDPRFIRIRPR